jgi:hypothetical protein
MTDQQPTENQKVVLYRGVLRLLKNESLSYQKYPYDDKQLKAAKAVLRARKRQRPAASTSDSLASNNSLKTLLDGQLASKDVSIFFFFHRRNKLKRDNI